MKKIKKLGITALAAVLVVSAAGCGKKGRKSIQKQRYRDVC